MFVNATIERFGGAPAVVKEYDHWLVLLRPQAVTLGSLVVAAKSPATAYGALPTHAFTEQARVVADIESALSRAVAHQKLNYLMLMMVDPHVHFHVIPRYEDARDFGGVSFPDAGWPKTPDLASAVPLSPDQVAAQIAWLKAAWPA